MTLSISCLLTLFSLTCETSFLNAFDKCVIGEILQLEFYVL